MNLVSFDAIDRRLLQLLQDNASLSLHEIGDIVGLSPSAVQRRLAGYKSTGLIANEVAVLNPEAVAGTVLACVFATLERESSQLHAEFQDRVCNTASVQQCYVLAGEVDYLVIIAASSMQRCRHIIDELFLDAPNIRRFETRVVFDVVKRGLQLPIE